MLQNTITKYKNKIKTTQKTLSEALRPHIKPTSSCTSFGEATLMLMPFSSSACNTFV
jgi:hypothetical protein